MTINPKWNLPRLRGQLLTENKLTHTYKHPILTELPFYWCQYNLYVCVLILLVQWSMNVFVVVYFQFLSFVFNIERQAILLQTTIIIHGRMDWTRIKLDMYIFNVKTWPNLLIIIWFFLSFGLCLEIVIRIFI